jgi:hypothetical protein
MKNEPGNLSGMYPVQSVRYVSGRSMDQVAAMPTSPSRFAGPSLSPLKGGEEPFFRLREA